MNRRATLRCLASGALAIASRLVFSQPRPERPKIGLLLPAGSAIDRPRWDHFFGAMQKLGYVEGKTVSYEYRSAEGHFERLPALAQGLMQAGVDVIVVANTPAALAAQRATVSIPVVMVEVGDPVGSGLVSNLARPAGNITGFTNIVRETTAKRIELLLDAAPGPRRIAVIGALIDPVTTAQIEDAQGAARSRGVELRIFEMNTVEEAGSAIEAARRWRATGALRLAEPLWVPSLPATIAAAERHRLPVIYPFSFGPENGGLFSYGPDRDEGHRRAADYVDRILKGARPSDLPVQQPTEIRLVVNLRAAQAIGISMPRSIVVRADELIR